MKKVYCDISATTPIDHEVLEYMANIDKQYFGNPSSIHKYGQESHAVIEKSRIQVSKALGCQNEEIIFTGSGTEANNIAIQGLINAGDHIISSSYEHPSVLKVLQKLEKSNVSITYIDPMKNGTIDPIEIKNNITDKTKLISIMYANNELGSINPISQIGDVAKENNIIFHVDAVQCVGKISIELKKLHIDLMSLSAHKFYGPKGIGALYIKKGIHLKTILGGGGQELDLRPGTENISGIAGLGLALEKSHENLKKNTKYIKSLENYFLTYLEENNIKYHLPIEERLPGVLAITFPRINGQSLLIALDLMGIAASFGSACSSGTSKASSTLLNIGMDEEQANSTLRISFGKIHCKEDIQYVGDCISNIIMRLSEKN